MSPSGLGDVSRDDSAWPKNALPVSVVVLLASLLVAGLVMASASRRGDGYLIAAAGGTLLSAVLWGSVLVVVVRRWLTGGRAVATPVEALAVVALILVETGAWVILVIFIEAWELGVGFLVGSFIGCMAGNVWAIRAARRNRGATPPR